MVYSQYLRWGENRSQEKFEEVFVPTYLMSPLLIINEERIQGSMESLLQIEEK